MSAVGAIVVIGRNEGPRLEIALASALATQWPVVYVDSQSSDGSVEVAERMGVPAIQLDNSRPVSAARARNEGFARVRAEFPDAVFVQFVDGDSELMRGWIEEAVATLEERPEAAVVFGRVRERHPERSTYNRLCDIEFARPGGEVRSCGGIFMVRTAAFARVGGFNPDVVAGEEPELCFRLRQVGFKVLSLESPMALHDADITRFAQWWKRSVRSGVAYAQGYALHASSSERFCRPQLRSIGMWTLGPLAALLLAWPTYGLSLLALMSIPAQALRIARRQPNVTGRRGDALLYGAACMAAKWPQVVGVIRFGQLKRRGLPPAIIEHKRPLAPAPGA